MWFGQKNYITPLHFDAANGMIFQIKGRKIIKFIPLEQTVNLYRHNIITGGGINFSQIPSFTREIDLDKYPLISKVTQSEILLEPGQILYIPPGCWHEVLYLDDCISLNYWYDIACNKGPSWLLLNLLACNYPSMEKNFYPFKYDDIMCKISVASDANKISAAKLMIGAYVESRVALKLGVAGSFLGNNDLAKMDLSNADPADIGLLIKINNLISEKSILKSLI